MRTKFVLGHDKKDFEACNRLAVAASNALYSVGCVGIAGFL